MNILQKILKFFNRGSQQNSPTTDTELIMEKLLNKLEITEEYEISCDDVHELLDQFTEMKMRGEDTAILMPLVDHHLRLCPDCFEEHELLLQALDIEKQINDK
jgi:hypothetical protein